MRAPGKQDAIFLVQSQRFREAQSLLARLCSSAPADPDLWYLRACASGQLGEHERVIQFCQRALAINPEYPAIFACLASAQATLGQYEAAVESYDRAIQHSPDDINLRICQSEAFRLIGRYQAAEHQLNMARKLDPDNARVLKMLGQVHYHCGKLRKALSCFRRLVDLTPEDPFAWACLGSALSWTMGCEQEAADAYLRARTLAPDDARITGKYANALAIAGDYEAAYACVRELIDRGEKDLFYAAEVYANICHRVGDCEEAAGVLESLLGDSHHAAAPDDVATLHFSLAKLYDKTGQYDLAFSHFRCANEHPPSSWDPAAYRESISKLIARFGRAQLRDLPRSGNTSSRPVFIIGTPRSGTSLVEQIISSHPSVHGAGELEYIHECVCDLIHNSGYPENTRCLTRSFVEQHAAGYLGQPALTDKAALRVTDKMPANHLHLGLISLLFPEARVIHCHRSPLDTCLSIYFQNFGGSNTYSKNLEHIGVFYREYLRIMAHWKRVLDIPIYDVKYEDLIDEQERISREMLEFCGIDWNPKCLEFYKSRRTITTNSYDQVRRPLYRSSVGKWRHYAAHLGKLKETLGLEQSAIG